MTGSSVRWEVLTRALIYRNCASRPGCCRLSIEATRMGKPETGANSAKIARSPAERKRTLKRVLGEDPRHLLRPRRDARLAVPDVAHAPEVVERRLAAAHEHPGHHDAVNFLEV